MIMDILKYLLSHCRFEKLDFKLRDQVQLHMFVDGNQLQWPLSVNVVGLAQGIKSSLELTKYLDVTIFNDSVCLKKHLGMIINLLVRQQAQANAIPNKHFINTIIFDGKIGDVL